MKFMEPMTNHNLINELISLVENKEEYIKIRKEGVRWYFLKDIEGSLEEFKKMVDEKYPDYKGKLIPLMHNQEDLICIYQGKYIWIHLTSPGWEKRGEYFTAKEVWDNRIKKDIDEYYDGTYYPTKSH